MTAIDLKSLWQRTADQPDHVFLSTPQTTLTYRDLGAAIRSELARFDAAGLAPGQRVLICTPDEVAAIIIFTAALLDGLVPVMLAPGTPERRLEAISEAVEPGLTCRSCTPGQAPASRLPRLPDAPDDLAYILFTSGTTESPSGVAISRRNLLSNVATISRLFGYGTQSRIFNDMALAHADGFVQGPLMALANGATLIRSGGFTLQGMEAWLDRVQETAATHVITVPTVWSLIHQFAKRDDYFSGHHCRALLTVAARLDTELWQRLERRFGRPVYNQYGLTETVASALYAGPHPDMGAPGTIGKPIDCAARIEAVHADAPTQPDGVGELQLRGDNVFAGYWRNPGRTAQCFTDDGWFRTGDLARQRPDGSYEILGRIKTIIMMAGFLIRPEEIDAVMMTHPAIAEAVTVGLPDTEFGEIPVTAVVLKGDADEVSLTAHARGALEPLKVPKRIIALPALPRGLSGKPDLKAIMEIVSTTLAARQDSSRAGTAVATEVLRIASRVFRTDPARLTLESTPSDVEGWDSYSYVTLLLAAETRFGLDIAAHHATDIKNLGDLAAVISEHRARSGLAAELSASELSEAGGKPAWTYLVAMQPAGNRIPLFFIHGLGGDISHFYPFARAVSPDQPVYGVRFKDAPDFDAPVKSLETLAEEYASEIRAVRPDGPYLVAGYSLGGWLAYAVAAELTRQGSDAKLLIFDTYPNCRPTWPAAGAHHVIRAIRFVSPAFLHLDELRQRSVMDWPRFLMTRRRVLSLIDRLRGTRAQDQSSSGPQPPPDRFLQAVAEYSPSRIQVDLDFVQATPPALALPLKSAQAAFWRLMVGGSVNIHQVSCIHGDIFAPEYVPELVRIADVFVQRNVSSHPS
jgi:acyl-CoA synthetase (AMP-forming)/AMP-acid ligase II/thioesterase domain-containing protein/acyl carrier protein